MLPLLELCNDIRYKIL